MIRSIRWRLVLAGGLAIALALALSGMGLAVLFERHVERVAVADLQARALALAAIIACTACALRKATRYLFWSIRVRTSA